MKALLASIVVTVGVLGSVYGFAATLALTGVDNISNQTETVLFNDVITPASCTISGGITCSVN